MSSFNYYEILGVQPDATPDQVKKAHHRLAKVHHPDFATLENTAGETTYQKLLNEVYDVLSDPVKRKRYDESGYCLKTDTPPPSESTEEPPVLVVQISELLRKTELEVDTTHQTELVIENQGRAAKVVDISYTPHDKWLKIVSVQKLGEREAQIIVIIDTHDLSLNQHYSGSITIMMDQTHATISISFQTVPPTHRSINYTSDDGCYSVPPPPSPLRPKPTPSPPPDPPLTPVDNSTWNWKMTGAIIGVVEAIMLALMIFFLWSLLFRGPSRHNYTDADIGHTATTTPSNAPTSAPSDTTIIVPLRFNQLIEIGEIPSPYSPPDRHDTIYSNSYVVDCTIGGQNVLGPVGGIYCNDYINGRSGVVRQYLTTLPNGLEVTIYPYDASYQSTIDYSSDGSRYMIHNRHSYVVSVRNPQKDEYHGLYANLSIECDGTIGEVWSRLRGEQQESIYTILKCPSPYRTIEFSFSFNHATVHTCRNKESGTREITLPDGVLTISLK